MTVDSSRRRSASGPAARGARRLRCGLLALAVAGACSDHPGGEPAADPVVLRVGIAQPAGAPSADAAVSNVAGRLLYAALVTTARDGTIQPGLAERWQASDDGRTLRFTLRRGLTFSTGARLDAGAVAAALEEVRRNPRLMPGLRDIVRVSADGDVDVVIEQRAHSALLLEALSQQWILGGPAAEVTAGPYRVVSRAAGRMALEAFDGYYRGRPAIDRVELIGYPSPRAAWVALMRNEIDLLYDVPPEATEFVEAATNVRAFPFLRSYVHLLGFNLDHPMLRDVRVRRAIVAAIDRRVLVDRAFAGRGVPAHSAVWPRHWAAADGIPDTGRDLGTARALLAAVAGRRQDGRAASSLTLSCLLPAGYPTFERSALVLQQQLLEVGIDLRPEVVPVQELSRRLGSGQFDTYLLEQATGLGLNWTYWFWHSPGEAPPWIRSNYAGADEALDRVRRAHDREAFRLAVGQLQQALTDDPPAAFLVWGEAFRAVRRRFLVPSEPDHDVFQTLHLWHVPGPESVE